MSHVLGRPELNGLKRLHLLHNGVQFNICDYFEMFHLTCFGLSPQVAGNENNYKLYYTHISLDQIFRLKNISTSFPVKIKKDGCLQ